MDLLAARSRGRDEGRWPAFLDDPETLTGAESARGVARWLERRRSSILSRPWCVLTRSPDEQPLPGVPQAVKD
jgi:hypothetical protein